MMEGGCYCGALRYRVTAAPVLRAQCHCRACQYISGGGPNYFMLVAPSGFEWTSGSPASFRRPDLDNAVTRAFCATCGTHVLTRRPGLDELVVKIGTLDDPAAYGGPAIAIFCAEKALFHVIPEGMPAFDTLPPPRRPKENRA
jgi:hypothetical protein